MQAAQMGTTSVLVLGATGMLGHAVVDELSRRSELVVTGAARSIDGIPTWFTEAHRSRIVTGFDVHDGNQRADLLDRVQPDLVLNAIGVVKQDPSVKDPIGTILTNALLPHLLLRDCSDRGTRLVHVSTDCVFSGERGAYAESDRPDPLDLYGRSKLLGEVDAPALTLRTSVVGHELRRHRSLVDWFLRQPPTQVTGFTRAIYAGLTTVEFARFLADFVVPHPELVGLWHVASTPITKYDFLRLLAAEYRWPGELIADAGFVCDRSLVADRLTEATGYRPPPWPEMVHDMHAGHGGARRSQSVRGSAP